MNGAAAGSGRRLLALVALATVGTGGHAQTLDDTLDRVGEALVWSDAGGAVRARLSGLVDLEGYALPAAAPALIDADGRRLFEPRLTVFLDAQVGPHVYAFAQARADRGFDPSGGPLRGRADEYAVRWMPLPDREWTLQAGKFATVVGSWTTRHDSWTNPFVSAPLPYENLTGVWDNEPPRSASQLMLWSHARPGLPAGVVDEKYVRIPILWGPGYATGIAMAGELGRFRYAVEMKNASLSSRPEAWTLDEARWGHPTFSGRVRYVPDPRWELGFSASSGPFLRPRAVATLPPGRGLGAYRQEVLGHDISFAWHHLQLWAEVFASRFRIPRVGNADTLAYYLEAKYRMTPRVSAAVRWNEQLYGRLREAQGSERWGLPVRRLDLAPTYRISAHTQIKVQHSIQWGDPDPRPTHLTAVQLTARF